MVRSCPACKAKIPKTAGYCVNCGLRQASRSWVVPVLIGSVAALLFAVVVIVWLYSSLTSSSMVASRASNATLNAQRVQKAVEIALDFTRFSGSVRVTGIQESPQTNSATADLYFDNFHYNCDSFGTPKPKTEKTPPPPDVNSPNWYEETANTFNTLRKEAKLTGRGVAILKHYNDGRWVLTEVHLGESYDAGVAPNSQVAP